MTSLESSAARLFVDPKDRLPAEWPSFQPRRMLARLTEAGVDFVVIGGIAVILSGYGRTTRDLDIMFAPDAANLTALGNVLTDLDATLRGVEEEVGFVPDARTLAGVQLLTLTTSLGWLDVHKQVGGVASYQQLRDRAVRVVIDDITVLVASVDDLLAMKTAAGRDVDRTDIAALEAIKRAR
jgi:predicted nucleotidyltransferase